MMTLMKEKKPENNDVVLAEKEDGKLFFAKYDNEGYYDGFRLFDDYGLTSNCINAKYVRSWIKLKNLKNLLGLK